MQSDHRRIQDGGKICAYYHLHRIKLSTFTKELMGW